MSKEQIKEMALAICESRMVADVDDCRKCRQNEFCLYQDIANGFYRAGYRKQEWISVEERLPDEAVRVLVWLREPSAILRFLQFDTDRIVDGRWVRWNNHITHWMPLPEPPKMKGGAE